MQSKNLWSLVFLALAAFPLFYNLTGPAIFIWDEAIYANNALEMALHGDPIVLKNNGEVSLYNTKPPLLIWLQALLIQLLGANEWAIRLPSALAALLTCGALLIFAARSLRDVRIAWVAVPVLVTSTGFVRNHVARSGDLDAMLVFWITFYSLLAFHYLLHLPPKHRRYFTWIGLGVAAAFLTKSVAGWMPLLGLGIAAWWQKRLWEILRKPYLYVVAAGVAFLCLGYYFLREKMAPGYLDKVLFSEYLRFTENIMPWHEQPFGFYLKNMWSRGFFQYYLFVLPVAIALALRGPRTLTRAFAAMATLFCLSYLLLISYPAVKLEWYDAPLYPFWALLIGIGAVRTYDWGVEKIKPALSTTTRTGIFLGLLLLLFAWPYREILQKNTSIAPVDPLEWEGYAMRQLAREQSTLQNYQVLMQVKYPEHLDQAHFYRKALKKDRGKNIVLLESLDQVSTALPILCCQTPGQDSLRQQFNTSLQKSIGPCQLLHLQ